MEEFIKSGHKVTVFCPNEKKYFGKLNNFKKNKVNIICIPTGRITKTKLFIKIVNTIFIEKKFTRAVLEECPQNIDLLLYSTPPINFVQTVHKIKLENRCITFLLLKDIFPQNAVDIGIIRPNGLVWKYFRLKEKKLYSKSDFIGCMSPANLEYVIKHNSEIQSNRITLCPNSIKPTMDYEFQNISIASFDKYGIIPSKLHLIYGGNLGKPQGVDFILQALKAISNDDGVFTTIVGNGTEYKKVKSAIKELRLKRVKLIPFLPNSEYKKLLSAMDVGLVFLDAKFTIPNFPSRILDYMDCSIPILACTDSVSDIKEEICDAGAGIWCKSDDVGGFVNAVKYLKENTDRRIQMGSLARKILKEKYSVDIVAKQILEMLNKKS